MTRSVICAVFMAAVGYGQSFEVASIKPAPPPENGKLRVSMGGDPGRINYSNVTLKDMIRQAYKVKDYQITAPAWMDSERYDVVAKLPESASNKDVPEMLQNLLAERFQLKLRKETRDFAIYALLAGKNGAKLEKSEDQGEGGKEKGGQSIQINDGKMEFKRVTLSGLAETLSRFVDRPVVDMSNTPGFFDVKLDISVVDLKKRMIGAGGGEGGPKSDGGLSGESDPAASVFTAVQQLGLKMEPRKAAMEFLVIERAERVPSEN